MLRFSSTGIPACANVKYALLVPYEQDRRTRSFAPWFCSTAHVATWGTGRNACATEKQKPRCFAPGLYFASRFASNRILVRSSGFEPPRYCYRQPLKLVRLPVPPRPLVPMQLTSSEVRPLCETPIISGFRGGVNIHGWFHVIAFTSRVHAMRAFLLFTLIRKFRAARRADFRPWRRTPRGHCQ